MKIKTSLLIIMLIIMAIQMKAQLSGTYTVGGVSPDYTTLHDFRNDIFTNGISGSVTVNIRDGVYNESFQLGAIAGVSPTDTVTIQSESGDSAAVTITSDGTVWPYNTFSLTYINFNVVFKNLTIQCTSTSDATISCDYASKSVSILNCNMSSEYFYCIQQGYGVGFKLQNCYLNNRTDITQGTGPINIKSNIFAANSNVTILYQAGAIIENNKFYRDTSTSNTCLQISYGNNHRLINNEFGRVVSLGFSGNCLIERNKFYGGVGMAFGGNSNIFNNFFYYDSLHSSITNYSNNDTMSSNNFAPNLTLNLSGSGNIYNNNNFSRTLSGTASNTFTHNNYPGSVIPWDTNPYTINPFYSDTLTDLHATNSLLAGRGIFLSSVLTDIDSVVRSNPPTIGANELTIPPCSAYYTTTYDSVLNNFTLYVDSITSAQATSYYWDFGDGSSSTLATPSHTYIVDTTYNVCMKIYTAIGDSCEYCHIIGKDYLGNIYRTTGFTINVHNISSGISQYPSKETTISIAPNPFTSQTTITFGEEQKNTTIIFTDVMGNQIRNYELGIRNEKSVTIDMSGFAKGIYFVRIADEKKNVVNRKIIVN